jgi:ribosomal protein L10
MTRPAFTEAQKRQHSAAMTKMWRMKRAAAKPATSSRRAPLSSKHELVQALQVIRKYLA